jgi:hypothetical protein
MYKQARVLTMVIPPKATRKNKTKAHASPCAQSVQKEP